MTQEKAKDQAPAGTHQIPLLGGSAPARQSKGIKPARSRTKPSSATKIASQDPDYDPDSLDLFQEAFAALSSESDPPSFTDAQGLPPERDHSDQFMREIRQTIVTDLTEIVDLLNPNPQQPKEPDL